MPLAVTPSLYRSGAAKYAGAAAALAFAVMGCSNETRGVLSDPDAQPATVVIETELRQPLYQRSLALRGRVEGTAVPVRMEMVIDPGTSAEHAVTGERGQYMTFPGTKEQAPFTWSIDATDTIAEGAHVVVVRLYDAMGRVWQDSAKYVSTLSAAPYTLTVLAGLGGADGGANGMNQAGDIAGWATDAGGHRQAVAWRSGRLDVLSHTDTLDGWANAINDRGEAVGAVSSRGGGCVQPALWTGTAGARLLVDVQAPPACQAGEAIAVNNSGLALVSATGYGYLIGPNGVVNLPFAYPYALNDLGQVVGQGSAFESAYAAGWNITFTPLDYLPFGAGHVFTAATGLNDREEVIGNSRGRPFFVKAGAESIDLMPYLGWTSPVALNDNGTVLAFEERTGTPYLWSGQRVSRVTLPPSEWQLIEVTSIDNSGRVAGRARSRLTGKTAAAVLTP